MRSVTPKSRTGEGERKGRINKVLDILAKRGKNKKKSAVLSLQKEL